MIFKLCGQFHCCRLLLRAAVSIMALGCCWWQVSAGVVFVTTNGNDALPGTSWETAKRSIASALTTASANTEIWVARGSYPGHLTLRPGVRLLGGFAGHESSVTERNWQTNLSIIWGTTNRTVVSITNSGPDTQMDGLTVAGGNGIHGGGISMVASAPIIANMTIRNNITDGAGAGISIWVFTP